MSFLSSSRRTEDLILCGVWDEGGKEWDESKERLQLLFAGWGWHLLKISNLLGVRMYAVGIVWHSKERDGVGLDVTLVGIENESVFARDFEEIV